MTAQLAAASVEDVAGQGVTAFAAAEQVVDRAAIGRVVGVFEHVESEREEGAALLCVAKPRSDLTIEGDVDVEEGVDVHPVRDYTATVDAVEAVTPTVRR